MFTPHPLLLPALLALLLIRSAPAQIVRPDANPDSTSRRQLTFSYAYMNPVSYRGRTFGVHQYGMIPQITYQAPSGWHVFTAGYIWNDFESPSQLGKVDLGVEKEGKLGKHLSYTLGYERWFFPNTDPGEVEALTNFTEAYLSGEWGDWTPSVGTYYMFGANQLLQTELELARNVSLAEGSGGWSLSLEPAVRVFLANQSLAVNGIYQTTPVVPVRPKPKPGTVVAAPVTSRPFNLVAAEIGLPLTLDTPRWSFVADGRLVKPYNTLPDERTSAFFYFVGTVSYKLFLN